MKWPQTEDLLYVTYDARKINPEKMIEAIRTAGFQAEIQQK